eukprot:g1248.t1
MLPGGQGGLPRRGARVTLGPGVTPPSVSCIRAGEVGTVAQHITDQQAWRLRRERRKLVLVRGPRGTSSVFPQGQLRLAPEAPPAPARGPRGGCLPAISRAEGFAKTCAAMPGTADAGDLPDGALRSSLLRAWSQGCGGNSQMGKGTLPCLALPPTPSYDATEDASASELEIVSREDEDGDNSGGDDDDGGTAAESKAGNRMSSANKDADDDPYWREIFDSARPATSKAPLRTRSEIDAGIRIAYWRDPVKVRKEHAKFKKLGTPAPKTAVLQRLQDEASFQVDIITAQDILSGALQPESYDVLCVPGGFAPNYLSALCAGHESSDSSASEDSDDSEANHIGGGRLIQEYVRRGGGYVGICAGAYAGSNWGWGLADVDLVDLDHWNRGMSQRCFCSITDDGKRVMNVPDQVEDVVVRYANGPLLAIGEGSVNTTSALALFASDFARKKHCPVGVMKDSPAIVAKREDESSKGRVLLVSPHPEDGEPWTKIYFRNLFRWAAKVDDGLEKHSIQEQQAV